MGGIEVIILVTVTSSFCGWFGYVGGWDACRSDRELKKLDKELKRLKRYP